MIDRPYMPCDCCGYPTQFWHYHHVFFNRDNRPKFKKWVDRPENMAKVCYDCHGVDGGSGIAKGRDFRVQWWKKQCSKYGDEHMRQWYDGVPYHVKEDY